MLRPTGKADDKDLLARFETEIRTKMPHFLDSPEGRVIVNATPLVDITDPLRECARLEYGLELSSKSIEVFGKFDSQIFGGSVKVRPAVEIIEDAIASGRLKSGQTIFETTSGNFGLALGMFGKLGLTVVVLVSRKLQEGVADQLRKNGVKLVNLDIDICPAPGLNMNPNLILAKSIATNVRDQLTQLELDITPFDLVRHEVEGLLARQDVINLAKLLAKAYGGFCPEQYDNGLNVKVHETVTGPEIDQQLKAQSKTIADYRMVSAFGTGGTSTGLGNYIQKKYGVRAVHVVFPLNNQDVAGIRTKEKALGLKFYRPEMYVGQHEVDFEAARPLFRFFVKKGYDIGESSALALYACLQMLNYGAGEKFVVILADGAEKYGKSLEAQIESTRSFEVTVQQASSSIGDYGKVLWTHGAFVPKEEGIKLIAASLGCDEGKIKVARAQDVQTLLSTDQMPESMKNLVPTDKSRLLLVCMAGVTSLRVAEMLATRGIEAQSLAGGITGIPSTNRREVPDLVQLAME